MWPTRLAATIVRYPVPDPMSRKDCPCSGPSAYNSKGMSSCMNVYTVFPVSTCMQQSQYKLATAVHTKPSVICQCIRQQHASKMTGSAGSKSALLTAQQGFNKTEFARKEGCCASPACRDRASVCRSPILADASKAGAAPSRSACSTTQHVKPQCGLISLIQA